MNLVSLVKKSHTFIKTLLQNNKSIVFFKFMAITILASFIPMLVFGIFSSRYSTEHIEMQVMQSNIGMLSQRKQILDQRVYEIDTLVNQQITNTDIWSILNADELPSNYIYKMLDISKVFSNTCSSNKLVESIYFYDEKHDLVISDTKYTKKDFFDPFVFSLSFDGNVYLTRPRTINNTRVISYIRKLSSFSRSNDGYIVVNINYNSLFNGFIQDIAGNVADIILFDDTYTTVFTSSPRFSSISPQALSYISDSLKAYDLVNLGGEDYFICKIKSDTLNWTYALVQNYTLLVRPAKLLRNTLLYIVVIILFFSLVMAYFLSISLYMPLASLVVQLNRYPNINALFNKLKRKNEYKMINYMFEDLMDRNTQLQSRYEVILPYFQQYSVLDLLNNNIFDQEKAQSILELLEVQFKKSGYFIGLMDFENTTCTEGSRGEISSYFQSYDQHLLFLLSKIDNSRIVVIINTDDDISSIYDLSHQLKEAMNRKSIQLTISLSSRFDSLEKVHVYYREALEKLEHKYFFGKNDVICSTSVYKSVKSSIIYDKSIEDELFNCIKSQNIHKAVKCFEDLTKSIPDNFEYAKYIYFQILTNIAFTLTELGANVDNPHLSGTNIFNQIKESKNVEELLRLSKTIIEQSTLLVGSLKQMQHRDFINKALEYIDKNFKKDLTLEEISGSIFISPGYLATLFKAETGMTVFGHITKLRMECACELLLSKNMKIQDISHSLGYNNVQCFIRFFKKFCKITPLEFRRKHAG